MPSKYAQLNDREWLRERYEADCLSIREIADLLGCTHKTVLKALIKHGLSRRGSGRSRPPLNRLHNYEWLYEQYIVEERSSNVIAREIGCNGGSVLRALHRLRIPVRSKSESKMVYNATRSQTRGLGANRQMVSAGRGTKVIEHLETGDGHGAIR